MQQTLTSEDINILDPDAVEEEVAEETSEQIVSRIAAEALEATQGMNQQESRKALLEYMNKILQAKNGKRLRKYQLEVKEWEAFVLDEKNEGKHAPFPTSPILLRPFNARQLNEAVFRARQYGKFGVLLEQAGFRATK